MTASLERQTSNALLAGWCQAITGDVLSIGSGQDADKQGRKYRDYFTWAASYATSEIVPGCDLRLDVRRMPEVPSASYDAVFCSGVLVHVDDIGAAVAECHRVLRPGGWFLVGVPFNQPIHRAPLDFWRFTEYGLRWLLRAFRVDDVQAIGSDPKSPASYWVRARKV